MGKPGQTVPEMTDDYCRTVAERYQELYTHITGAPFEGIGESDDLAADIEAAVNAWLKQ